MAAPSRKTKYSRISQNCPFCKSGSTPDYKDYETLKDYITDRARIVGSKRSGICSGHQRKLTVAIKRARHLGLLPFTPAL